MRMIDDKGRLFGRVNIVDAAVGLFLVLVIPLAYGTALLFRPASPRIESVSRVDITNEERRIMGGGSLLTAKLKLKGTALNPMLRAYIDESPALAFVFENPNSADILVGQVAPGAHDLVLFDGVQEVARAKGAIVIDSPSTRTVRAEGWLTNLDPALASQIDVDYSFPPPSGVHRVVAIGEARPALSRMRLSGVDAYLPIAARVERRVVVLLQCDPQGADFRTGQEPCTVGGQPVAGVGPVSVVMPGPVAIGFAIEEIFPIEPPAKTRIALILDDGPGGNSVRAGDRDDILDDRGAVVASVQGRRVVIDLGLDPGRDGWRYRGQAVKPGAAFALSTARYEARGRVETMTPPVLPGPGNGK